MIIARVREQKQRDGHESSTILTVPKDAKLAIGSYVRIVPITEDA